MVEHQKWAPALTTDSSAPMVVLKAAVAMVAPSSAMVVMQGKSSE